MKLKKFLLNKLVRDNVPAQLESEGSILHWHYLNDTQYDVALREKLVEESEEALQAENREDLIKELASILEAMDALCALHNISKDELLDIQAQKREAKGGYFTRKFVAIAEFAENSPEAKYYLAQDLKYPEIKE